MRQVPMNLKLSVTDALTSSLANRLKTQNQDGGQATDKHKVDWTASSSAAVAGNLKMFRYEDDVYIYIL